MNLLYETHSLRNRRIPPLYDWFAPSINLIEQIIPDLLQSQTFRESSSGSYKHAEVTHRRESL